MERMEGITKTGAWAAFVLSETSLRITVTALIQALV